MKPINMLGFGPRYYTEHLPDGNYKITVTPPGRDEGTSVTLTPKQYLGYIGWKDRGELIQDAIPDLPAPQREILITGIGPEEWAKLFPPEEDDE